MKIFITGASGVIGGVLMKCLSKKHQVIGIDKKPSQDVIVLDIVKEPAKVKKLLRTQDIIIHLAWNTKEAGAVLAPILEENKKMAEIMLEAALEMKVLKFILASSVHVSLGHLGYKYDISKNHQLLHKKEIRVEDGFCPLGAYGASKVYLEALGRAYAFRGLQVITVRFGNVTSDNSFGEYPFWLSHRDCGQFIEKCCLAKNLPAFSTFFAISNNPCNPFDLSETKKYLNYQPKDSSKCLLSL